MNPFSECRKTLQKNSGSLQTHIKPPNSLNKHVKTLIAFAAIISTLFTVSSASLTELAYLA